MICARKSLLAAKRARPARPGLRDGWDPTRPRRLADTPRHNANAIARVVPHPQCAPARFRSRSYRGDGVRWRRCAPVQGTLAYHRRAFRKRPVQVTHLSRPQPLGEPSEPSRSRSPGHDSRPRAIGPAQTPRWGWRVLPCAPDTTGIAAGGGNRNPGRAAAPGRIGHTAHSPAI